MNVERGPRLTPARHRVLNRLLDELLEHPAVEREARAAEVGRRCPRLGRWLDELLRASAAPTSYLLSPAGRIADQAWSAVESSVRHLPRGTRMGPWRLLEPAGAGGMGQVYRAERADGAFDMQAAVKLMRPGVGDLGERLAMERQALARLDHPGIARLLDGGVTDDGRAYLVMDWVPGEDLARAELTGDARLETFVQIADAVSHAHQRMIVHGDIKPANVRLMPNGRARLLDFGVARILAGERKHDPVMPGMTPAFAAPELRDGEPATALSDVWALGALLAWLLTGRVPVKGKPVTAARLDGSRKRDLAAIVNRAMAEDPARRYPSASALADDMRRVLNHEPIGAAATGWPRRAALWVRRNPVAGVLAALMAVSIAAGTVVSIWQMRIAMAERDVARFEAERWAVMVDQLTMLFREAAGEGDLSARELLAGSAEMLERDLYDDPAVRAQMLGVLATLYFSLQDYPAARPLLESFLIHDDGSAPAPLRAQVHMELAEIEQAQGRVDRAAELIDQAEGILKPLPGDHSDRLSIIEQVRGRIFRSQGRWPEAVAALESGIELARRSDGRPTRRLGIALSNLGTTLALSGELRDAQARYQESLAVWRALDLVDTPDALTVMGNLATILGKLGLIDKAEPLYPEVIELRRERYGDSGALAAAYNNYGMLLLTRYRLDEAREHIERGHVMMAYVHGQGGLEYSQTLFALGELAMVEGDMAGADTYFAQAEAVRSAALGPDHLLTVQMRAYRAFVLRHTDPGAATGAFARVIAALESAGPSAGPHLAPVLCEQAMLYLDRGEPEPALRAASRCLEQREASMPPESYFRAEAGALAAAAEWRAGDASAAGRLDEHLAILNETYGAGHPRLLWFQRESAGIH